MGSTSLVINQLHTMIQIGSHNFLCPRAKLLRRVKDWDPRDNDIHSRVPAHRTAIFQIDEFHTENPVHT